MYRGERNKLYEYDGEKHTILEWARKYGMSYYLLKERLYRGWTLERALAQPKQVKIN